MMKEGLHGVVAAWQRSNRWGWSLVSQIRPRVSLLTGSVLVLLTLFLPIAYEACGPNRTGYEFARGEGKGIWPGLFLGLIFEDSGRAFYLLSLALAVLTLALVLLPGRADLMRRPRLITWVYALAGTLSLLAIVDFFWVFVGLTLGGFLEELLGGARITTTVTAGVAFLVLVSCLRSEFLRRQRWITGLFGIASVSSLCLMADYFLSLCGSPPIIDADTATAMMTAPSILYWVVPVVLWYQFGFSRRNELRAQWLGIRSRLIQMYVPVAAADCFFFVDVVKMGIWSFVPFFVGLHLISLGYLQLARQVWPLSQRTTKGASPV